MSQSTRAKCWHPESQTGPLRRALLLRWAVPLLFHWAVPCPCPREGKYRTRLALLPAPGSQGRRGGEGRGLTRPMGARGHVALRAADAVQLQREREICSPSFLMVTAETLPLELGGKSQSSVGKLWKSQQA